MKTRTQRTASPPKITVSLTVEKPPVVDELSWYQMQDRRGGFLRTKWSHLTRTPKSLDRKAEPLVSAPLRGDWAPVKRQR